MLTMSTMLSKNFNHSLILCVYVYILCVLVLSHFICVQHFATLWTLACQAPLSMGFSRQEY